jgi:thioredoxin 1
MIKQKGITIVDFWAPWCGPCKTISPILDQIQTENKDVRVVKINVDEADDNTSKTLIQENNIRAIPFLSIYKDGQIVDNIIGVVPKSHIEGVINKYR